MDDSVRQPLTANVVQHMRRLNRAIYAATESVWRELDLTMSQMKLLHVLAHQESLPVGQVAELLGIGEPSASLMVDRLVRQGLVTRREDPADRRRTLTSLSPRGEELVTTLRQGSRQLLGEWLSRMTEEDLSALAQGLSGLAAAAEASYGHLRTADMNSSNNGNHPQGGKVS